MTSAYGLAWLAACGCVWLLARAMPPVAAGNRTQSPAVRDRLLVWALIGALLGGRLGYAALYEPGYYLADPAEILRLWRGGLSFHGGLAGVAAAAWLVTRSEEAFFRPALDRLALLAPFGLAPGRLGNYLTAELWGRTTDLPWAVVFPGAGPEARHPTQLYEALWEGPVLALILLRLTRRGGPPGRAAAGFAIFYSLGRFGVEFLRVPDPGWGYLAGGWLTLGQVLSLGLAALGLALWPRRATLGYFQGRQP